MARADRIFSAPEIRPVRLQVFLASRNSRRKQISDTVLENGRVQATSTRLFAATPGQRWRRRERERGGEHERQRTRVH